MIALSTTIIYLIYLEFALHVMMPEDDLGWIRPIIIRLKRIPAPARIKRHLLVASDDMFECGLKIMDKSEQSSNETAAQRASRFRDGLMLAFLAARPLRRGNFASIEMGRHLVKREDGYWLYFDASEMKNRIAFEVPLPSTLTSYLERYITQHRPVLCKSADVFRGTRLHLPGDHLWVTNRHSAISPGSVYGRIMALTKEVFGHSIHPHLFRDSAATSIACEDPTHVYITKSILGHTTLRTSERHYIHAQSLEATRRYQARVLELREPARARHGQAGRKLFMKG
jgi:integrase